MPDRQGKRQRKSTASTAADTAEAYNHTFNPLLGLPCLNDIVALVQPIDSLGLGVASRELRRRWCGATVTWLERAVDEQDRWLRSVFRPWQATAYHSILVTSFATSDETFAQWKALVTTHVLAPLRAGTPFGTLLRQRPPVREDGAWTEFVQQGKTLGRHGIFDALKQLPWRLLWERVWLVYAWLPRVWKRLSLAGAVDPRLQYVLPHRRTRSIRSDLSSVCTDHPLDRVMATVLPLCLKKSQWRAPRTLRRPLVDLRLPPPVELAPDKPLGRLARRLAHRWYNHPMLKFHSGPDSTETLWSVAWRRTPRPLCGLLAELRRGPELLALLYRPPQAASGWQLLRLRPAGQDGLGFFRRLGENWSEVLAESGGRTGRCVWCSKRSPAAQRTGQGATCAALAS